MFNIENPYNVKQKNIGNHSYKDVISIIFVQLSVSSFFNEFKHVIQM
jgi:hypothetical protein